MAKCNSCGGEVVLTKNGTYRCRSCGVEMDIQEFGCGDFYQDIIIEKTGGPFERRPKPPVERKPAKCPCTKQVLPKCFPVVCLR